MTALLLASVATAQQPNIVILNVDDMGWGDFANYGSQFSQTPNIDQLAADGTSFTQFYAGSSICSPSRASLFTGQYAARSNINSFLNNSNDNLNRDNANFLELSAPSMAQTFKDGGYTTGHFGKWHLGGGRDVGYEVNPTPGTNVAAPRIVEYGYDDVWTQFEGLGNRIINVQDYGGDADGVSVRPSNYMNGLNRQSDERGTGGGLDQIVYLEREFNSTFTVNRAIDFIDNAQANDPDQPFFMNVWFDETHTQHDPPAALEAKYDALYPGLPTESRDYLAVLEALDTQIGRLVDHIDQQGLGNDTIIMIMADNGATDTNVNNIGSSGPFRGTKGDLFEGGVRSPLIVRWTGNVAANRVDEDTVMWMPDLFPTLTSVANVANPAGVTFDGEDLTDAFLGNATMERNGVLFWNMNRGTENRHNNPIANGAGANGQEVIAVRKGDWKLVINATGTVPELYDLSTDLGEQSNVADDEQFVTSTLAREALSIRYEMPARRLPDFANPIVRLKAEDLAGQGNNAAVSSWNDSATGDGFNGNVSQGTANSQPTLLTDALNGKAVVEFDGTDVLLSSTNNSLPDASEGITVFAVVTGDSSGESAERLAQLGDSSGTPGEVVGFDISTSTSTTDPSNGGAGFRYNDGAALYDTPLTDTEFHIVIWQVDDGQAYEDATLFVGGTTDDKTFAGNSNNPTGTVGFSGNDLELILGTGRGGGGGLNNGDRITAQLAEFVVYNGQLTIGEMNLVANYLASEYGLSFDYKLPVELVLDPGDLNADGQIDEDDLQIITANFGAAVTPGQLDLGDANGDGNVGIEDIDLVLANWTGIGTPPATVPEPASAIAFGVLWLALGRWGR